MCILILCIWVAFFSLSTSVYSALGAVFFGVDALYKLTFYLLTYLLGGVVVSVLDS